MSENIEQAIVLIQKSEDGPSDKTIAEMEKEVEEIFDSDATVNPCGRGMIAVNSDDPLMTARELSDTVEASTAYGVSDYVVTAVEHIDNVQELLSE